MFWDGFASVPQCVQMAEPSSSSKIVGSPHATQGSRLIQGVRRKILNDVLMTFRQKVRAQDVLAALIGEVAS